MTKTGSLKLIDISACRPLGDLETDVIIHRDEAVCGSLRPGKSTWGLVLLTEESSGKGLNGHPVNYFQYHTRSRLLRPEQVSD